jgi:hypothetical protein
MDDGLYVLWNFVDIDNVANVYNYPRYQEVHFLLQNNSTQQSSTFYYDMQLALICRQPYDIKYQIGRSY